MTREELEILYKDKILPESKDPYHFEKRPDSDVAVKAYNPMCGDKFFLYIDEEDGRLDLHFDGFGCAISKASTSVLTRLLEGKTAEEAKVVAGEFLTALETGNFDAIDDDRAMVLLELRNFEGRTDCIKLSWEALNNHFRKD